MKRCFLVFFAIDLVLGGSVLSSKHNLSVTGSGKIKSYEASEVCVFCHTTHHSKRSIPLWNRELSEVVYETYSSSTLRSIPGQPDGTTKMCLSCHDGTIAVGHVLSRDKQIGMMNTDANKIPTSQNSLIGLDLSNDHPVSFDPTRAVAESEELQHPRGHLGVFYDHAGKIQCTTCHNAHDDQFDDFLVQSNLNGDLCKACHNLKGYSGFTTHDISTKTWNGNGPDPWPHTSFGTVGWNSCANCHRSHGALGSQRLLSHAREEDVCLVCHDGSVAQDIASQLTKPSAHRVFAYQGQHDPQEVISRAPLHVECADCHDPHRLRSGEASAPMIQGALVGASGADLSGHPLESADFQWQVCLKCHGDDQFYVQPAVFRSDDTSNIATAFNPINASFHPVITSGKNPRVASLLPPYSTSSRIFCTDCHNSNDYLSGSKGPHGSTNPFILERTYVTADPNPYAESDYGLCFKCHSSSGLLFSQTSYSTLHYRHLRKDAPCSVCHDPHGSPNNVGLINFDNLVVLPNQFGMLRFAVIGNKGTCNLNCHNEEHQNREYERL